eukprot:1519283-Rhodomonas_salina.1
MPAAPALVFPSLQPDAPVSMPVQPPKSSLRAADLDISEREDWRRYKMRDDFGAKMTGLTEMRGAVWKGNAGSARDGGGGGGGYGGGRA